MTGPIFLASTAKHLAGTHSADQHRVWAAPVALLTDRRMEADNGVAQTVTISQASPITRPRRAIAYASPLMVPTTDFSLLTDPPIGGAQSVMLSKAPPRIAPLSSPSQRTKSDHLSVSAWMLWRHDGANSRTSSGAATPLYGASQVGARIAYRFDAVRPVEAYARASAPLSLKDGKEIAIGGAILPFKSVNVALAVEQRFRLDGGRRSAPAVLAYGGFGPKALGPFEAEGYAQAGVVGIRDPNLFADGAAVVRKQIARSGNATVHVGAGVWGGAQRGASRLDIGPRLGVDVPVKDGPNLRLALDWRERIAGPAHPVSGPAVSLGTDF